MNYFREQLMEIFELPPEVIIDAPLIMIAGKQNLHIENHKGISFYKDDLLKIRIREGFLVVQGNNLMIKEINRDYIQISGKMQGFFYEKL